MRRDQAPARSSVISREIVTTCGALVSAFAASIARHLPSGLTTRELWHMAPTDRILQICLGQG